MWHNSLGATAVYLSWIGLVLVMRKFPKLGIYVVMFTDIFKTFAQFFVVCFLFIVAFGLGFHILLYDQVCDVTFSTRVTLRWRISPNKPYFAALSSRRVREPSAHVVACL